MKPLFILIAISLSLAISSCGSNSSGKESKTNNLTNSPDASSSSAQPKANFSCLMNDKPISGNSDGNVQTYNTAVIRPDKEQGDKIEIGLYSTKDGNDYNPDYFITIRCPARTGSYIKKANQEFDDKTMPWFKLDFLTGDFSVYWATNSGDDEVTINIISMTSNRVTGTFAASISLSNDTPKGTIKKVTLKDGTFDVPIKQ